MVEQIHPLPCQHEEAPTWVGRVDTVGMGMEEDSGEGAVAAGSHKEEHIGGQEERQLQREVELALVLHCGLAYAAFAIQKNERLEEGTPVLR